MNIQEKLNLMVGKTITSTDISNSSNWEKDDLIIFTFDDGTSFKVEAYAYQGEPGLNVNIC